MIAVEVPSERASTDRASPCSRAGSRSRSQPLPSTWSSSRSSGARRGDSGRSRLTVDVGRDGPGSRRGDGGPHAAGSVPAGWARPATSAQRNQVPPPTANGPRPYRRTNRCSHQPPRRQARRSGASCSSATRWPRAFLPGLEDAAKEQGIELYPASVCGCGVIAGEPADLSGAACKWSAACERAGPGVRANATHAYQPDVLVWLSGWDRTDRILLSVRERDDDRRPPLRASLIDEAANRLTSTGATLVMLTSPASPNDQYPDPPPYRPSRT
jgi:hypothetical protein